MTKITAITEIPNTKIEPALAAAIFDLINKFANYGFNRSHAAAYGVIGFQTAYLKAHYPHEFYAASMNLDLGDLDKLSEFARDMRRTGLAFLGPDINASDVRFSVETRPNGEKAVRWALSGIKGVGESAMLAAMAERKAGGPYTSFQDFVTRTGGKGLNRKAYEGLIMSGALDCLHKNRAEMLYNLADLMAVANSDAKSKQTGQVSMFDFVAPPTESTRLKHLPESPKLTLLQNEFDVLGMYVSGHPIEQAEAKLARLRDRITIRQATAQGFRAQRNRDYKLGAIISGMRIRTTKKGDTMASLNLSDPTGTIEAPMFPNEYARFSKTIMPGQAFVFTCGLEDEKDDKGELTGNKKIIVRAAEPLDLTMQAAA